MRSNNLTLGAILNSPNQYVIPVFQRYYRWSQPEWDKLWTDLTELQHPGKTGTHFMGFLVLVPESPMPGQITKYHLIDGQQRITTISLMLCALRDVASTTGHERLSEQVHQTFLIHPFEKGTARFRLYPKQRDREQFIAVLNRETPAEGRIGTAVRYFSDRLATIPGAGTEDGLRAFLSLLTQRLEFIHATLEGENPFNIFKSLNSTGVPLSQADLIRNFVFMHVPVGDQDEFEEVRWKPVERRFEDEQGTLDGNAFSSFLRDNLMSEGVYVPPTETFETFQRQYSSTDFDPKQLGDDLRRAADYYEVINGRRSDPDPEVEAALVGLRRLESSTTNPLVLHLFDLRHRGQLAPSDLAEALRMLSGFILRRLVCNESSRGYARMFAPASLALGALPLEGLREFLEARGFPDTPRFCQQFVGFNLYASRYCKAVLEALERANGHHEQVVLTNTQVEHVMPQTLSDGWRADLGLDADQVHAKWLHAPGNLTLTGYNPELANKAFAGKRQEYAKSNIVMTRRLAESTAWGEADIQNRGQEMAEIAARLWPGPAAPVRTAEKAARSDTPSRYDLRLRFWTAFRDHVQASGSTLALKEPKAEYNLRCGRLGARISLYAYLNLRHERIAVSVYFKGDTPRRVFDSIRECRDEIENEIGGKLNWLQNGGATWGEVILRNNVDPTDESRWPSYFEWMRKGLESLRDAVGSRLPEAQVADGREGKVTTTGTLQLAYWAALRDLVLANSTVLRPKKPFPQAWTTFAIGRSGFNLSALVHKTKRWVEIQVYLDGKHAKSNFHLLARDKDVIEAELGQPLDWRETPENRSSQIALHWGNVDITDRADWPRQHRWFLENLEALHRVFAPRIRALDSGTLEPPHEAPP